MYTNLGQIFKIVSLRAHFEDKPSPFAILKINRPHSPGRSHFGHEVLLFFRVMWQASLVYTRDIVPKKWRANSCLGSPILAIAIIIAPTYEKSASCPTRCDPQGEYILHITSKTIIQTWRCSHEDLSRSESIASSEEGNPYSSAVLLWLLALPVTTCRVDHKTNQHGGIATDWVNGLADRSREVFWTKNIAAYTWYTNIFVCAACMYVLLLRTSDIIAGCFRDNNVQHVLLDSRTTFIEVNPGAHNTYPQYVIHGTNYERVQDEKSNIVILEPIIDKSNGQMLHVHGARSTSAWDLPELSILFRV